MVRNSRWIPLFQAVVLAAGAWASGCGSNPVTKPPNHGQDAGGDIIVIPDTGYVQSHPDGGAVNNEARMLSAVGDIAPSVELGGKVDITALLVGTGVGSIGNAPVTFTLTGDGTLSANTVSTSVAGLATVTFTAPMTAGVAHITASADRVATADQAFWTVKVVTPSRKIVLQNSKQLVVTPRQAAKGAVKLVVYNPGGTNDGLPVPGGKITFRVASGNDRQSVLINGKNLDSDTVTTGIDGMARLTLTVSAVAQEFQFSIEIAEDYAASQFFSVDVMPNSDVACQHDSDCPTGMKCDTSNSPYVCVPKPECTLSSDCNQGYTCWLNRCVLATVSCTKPADCAGQPGTYCDTSLGQCVIGCTTSADCTGARNACDPVKHICVYPTQLSCSTDADCPANYRCDGTRCIPRTTSNTSCTDSMDCPFDQYCDTNLGVCVPGCETDAQCMTGSANFCDVASHVCQAGCTTDPECFPQVCDVPTGRCVDVATVILDVSGDWDAVQFFHVKNLVPAGMQSALAAVDTAFKTLEAVIDCNVSQFVPGWILTACGIFGDCAQAIDDTVCGSISSYVPSWLSTAVHIGADVSKVINDFEVHSKMHIDQPCKPSGTITCASTAKETISGLDDWQTAYFYWYTDNCPTPGPGDPPPQCALVELDITTADVHPSPSPFTGKVDGTTLKIDTHDINLHYGALVAMLINKLLESQTGYSTLAEAIEAAVDCAAINSWIQNVVAGIVGQSVASYIDITGVCTSGVHSAATAVTNAINNLNSNLPMSLQGKAGIVQLPGNTSNEADRLAPGVWYTKFPSSGETLIQFGEWYADRAY